MCGIDESLKKTMIRHRSRYGSKLNMEKMPKIKAVKTIGEGDYLLLSIAELRKYMIVVSFFPGHSFTCLQVPHFSMLFASIPEVMVFHGVMTLT